MAEVIPIRSDSAGPRVRVRLDGSFYRLSFAWNTRFEYWAASVESDSGDAVLLGSVVRADTPMTLAHQQTGMPLGELVAIDTSGAGLDPGRNDLGERVELLYVTASELSA
ncbi:MAG: hypothetical protein GY926_19340 [bacterium]|nr:hypothetical protein [bacterium]